MDPWVQNGHTALQVLLNWVVEPLFELRWVPLQSLGALSGKTGDLPDGAEGLTGEEDPPSWEVLLHLHSLILVPIPASLLTSCEAVDKWQPPVSYSTIKRAFIVPPGCWTLSCQLSSTSEGENPALTVYNMGSRYETSNQVNTQWITEGDKKLQKKNTKKCLSFHVCKMGYQWCQFHGTLVLRL